jgi:methylated-DNA-protein-cysteine methyltransferase related protein
LARAHAAAAGKNVIVMGGADLLRRYLAAGVVDEFTLTIAPVLPGAGKRLFDGISRTDIVFERTAVVESPFATHLRFAFGQTAPRDIAGLMQSPRVAGEDRESRRERIVERVQAIPEGFVRTYGDIDPAAPRLVGLVLSRTHGIPWHRVVRADGSLPKGTAQRRLLLREGVPMRGQRVDLAEARLPPDL